MHLTLHLTGRCQLRCRYCYDAHAEGAMTFDEVRAAVALARRNHQGSLGISFFGGEPLLCRELITRTLDHCRELTRTTGQRFHFKITTNGLLLDEEFLTGATRSIFVALSHDGVQPAHDTHRVNAAGVGSFAKLDSVIDLLLRHKPYAPVMLVVTPETVPHYADSIEYLYQRGFRYMIATPHFNGAWQDRDLNELERQYLRLAEWYERETLAEAKFYFSPFDVKIATHVLPGHCRESRCDFGGRQVSIAPGGKIYPCVQFVDDGTDPTFAIGDVWAGVDEDKHRRLMALNADEKQECRNCAIQERCNHFCGCMNWRATGGIDQVAPMVCAHERIVLPIADKVGGRLYKRRAPMFLQKHYNDMYPLLSMLEDAVLPPTNPR